MAERIGDKQQAVRVFDDNGKMVTSVGPMFGSTKLDKIADIAVDTGYALYLLDADLHQIAVAALRLTGDGRVTAEPIGNVPVPAEGNRAVKNPSAVAVTPSGTILIAGKSGAFMLRFR